HSDDFSDIHLDELQDDVGSYVLSGGKLILSGWKHPSVFSEGFVSRFLPDITLNQHNTAVFKAAHSSQYPSLYPDPTKLAAPWNGMLPMTYTFSGAQSPLYTAQIHEGGFGEGLPAAIHIHAKGEMVLLGFPLYFMEAERVKGFLQSIITQLQTVQEPDGSPSAKLYPNPLRENQILRLQLDNSTLNSLEIFNIRGQKVISLQDLPLSGSGSAQHYQMPMQQLNNLASGCYLLKLNTSAGKMKKKIVIIR
ncbi:MAG: T9SS type A sorting domain-containing protein, partial [Candidatus Cloacimonetes bacterium]|nr:T9SS type A sorting domain-containing protein [Candidatus Cloacimonadota bacterium]